MLKSIRNNKIDILRFLGIILIILAHCDAPLEINNFRCFDVILLVFISAYMYDENKCINKNIYIIYIKKKVQRLLKPTYIFIISFSLVLFIGYRLMGRPELFGIKQLINSLLLCEDSVGYVWIMKVYFINALLAPYFVYMQKQSYNSIKFFKKMFIQFIVYEIIVYFYNLLITDSNHIMWILIHEWLICCMAYSFIAQISLWHKKNDFCKNYGWILWGGIFILTLIVKSDFCTIAGKRPPNLHYLSWGLFITELLFRVIPDYEIKSVMWISKHSLEIYFIHPFFILFFSLLKNIFKINYNCFWLIEFILVVFFSIISVKIFNMIRIIIKKHNL